MAWLVKFVDLSVIIVPSHVKAVEELGRVVILLVYRPEAPRHVEELLVDGARNGQNDITVELVATYTDRLVVQIQFH